MKITKTLLALALVSASSLAFAAPGNGNGNGSGNGTPNGNTPTPVTTPGQPQVGGGAFVIGGVASGYAGSIDGTVKSESIGNSVTAAQVNGFGTSIQSASNSTYGGANVGGNITPVGVTVASSQWSGSDSFAQGSITGNAPIEVDGALANASAAFGQSEGKAKVGGTFQAGQIGGIIAIGAIGGSFGTNPF